jgi:hypothetical protein
VQLAASQEGLSFAELVIYPMKGKKDLNKKVYIFSDSVQCSLDIREGCVPRLTVNSKKPHIIYALSLVTPLSEKHFLKVNVHPTTASVV